MDNSAFQKLVRDRAHGKSTKEIARDAVQAEFQRKRKKGRYNDYSSDEEDRSSKRMNKNNRREDMWGGYEAPSKDASKEQVSSSTYRDRAKERREGKDSIGDELLDEEFTDTFTKQERTPKPRIRPSSSREESDGEGKTTEFCKTREQAQSFLLSLQSSSTLERRVKSGLGNEIVSYLETTFLSSSQANDASEPSTAGNALHRTVLTFTTEAHPGDLHRAWEVPREQTFASEKINVADLSAKACTCPEDLLRRMGMALNNSKRSRQVQPESVEATAVNGSTALQDEDSDDEDIFGNLTLYDPLPAPDADQSSGKSSGATEKKSFFEEVQTKSSASTVKPVAPNKKPANDVDLSDGELDGTSTIKQHIPQRLEGFTSSDANVGGYGEEMDVDFDGRFDEDPEDGKKKSKKSKKKQGDEDED